MNNVSPTARSFAPWIVAAIVATLALLCAWLGQLALTMRAENALLRQEQSLAALELRAAHNQLEAERIVLHREITDLRRQLQSRNAPPPAKLPP